MMKWMVPLLSVGIISTGSVLAEANGTSVMRNSLGAAIELEEMVAITVTGKVTSTGDDSGLPGVTILEKEQAMGRLRILTGHIALT